MLSIFLHKELLYLIFSCVSIIYMLTSHAPYGAFFESTVIMLFCVENDDDYCYPINGQIGVGWENRWA